MDKFEALLGRWTGRGVATFPTIETVDYTEELHFSAAKAHELVAYTQAARLANGEPSHWETGLIMASPESGYEWRNAQNSGRGELLTGRIVESGAGLLRLEFRSAGFHTDERMIETRRVLVVTGDTLQYEVFMATTTTDEPRLLSHLKAELTRGPSGV